LDADDVWKPDKLARQVAVLEHDPDTGLVHSDLDIIDGEGRWVERMACSGRASAFSAEFLDGQLIYPSATLIRADLLRAVGGFSEDLPGAGYEDIELWVRLSGRCRFRCLSEPLVSYRIHAHNNTKISEMGLRNRGIFLEKVWAAHGASDYRRFLRREFAKFYSDTGKSLIHQGRVWEGRAYLRRAIATSGTDGRHLKTFLRACLRLGRSYFRRAVGEKPTAVNQGDERLLNRRE
jgi:GT2 family glycosyltransferase